MWFQNETTLLLLIGLQVLPIVVGIQNATAEKGRQLLSTWKREKLMQFAELLRESIQIDSQPCDDFYAYACGKRAPTSGITSREEAFRFFVNHRAANHMSPAEAKIKDFYLSCRFSRQIEKLEATKLYKSVGGWPAIQTPSSAGGINHVGWMQIISAFDHFGSNSVFNHKIEIQNNQRIIKIRPNLRTDFPLDGYKEMARRLLRGYGVSHDSSELITGACADFELRRRAILDDSMKVKGEKELTFSQLREEYPNVEWAAYFTQILGKPPKASDMVILLNVAVFKPLFEFLSATKTGVILDYYWIAYLHRKGEPYCVHMLQDYFGAGYSAIVDRPPYNRRDLMDMVTSLGRSFTDKVAPSVWIDEIAAANSEKFLNEISNLILNEDDRIDQAYANVVINRTDFWANLENLERHYASGGERYKSRLGAIYTHFKAPLYNGNFSVHLNYGSVGQSLAESLIKGGGSGGGVATTTHHSSWRSSDSDETFRQLENCILKQSPTLSGQIDQLILRILSQRISFDAMLRWLHANRDLHQEINRILGRGFDSLTIQRMYFLVATMTSCQRGEDKEFLNAVAGNSDLFADAFGCKKVMACNKV